MLLNWLESMAVHTRAEFDRRRVYYLNDLSLLYITGEQ